MRRRNKKHYSIYIAWILLLLCVIGGLKAGIEESAVGKEQTHSEISIQSRWEELLKSVSEKKNDKKKDQKKSESTEAAQKNIRILLMTDGYKQIVHKELKVSPLPELYKKLHSYLHLISSLRVMYGIRRSGTDD